MAESTPIAKDPENEAPPESFIPNDSTAQEGVSMGDHCVTDRPTPPGLTPTGEISKLADVDVYITKPSDYPHSPSKLLLLLSSGTGIHSTNNQIQADKYAEEGFLVVMPDQFGGDPAPNSANVNVGQEESPSIIEQVKVKAAETVQSFMIDMWLARQTPEKVMPILLKVVEAAKDEFADAIANGGGIYAAGYCFGGKYVLLLGSELPDTVLHDQAPKDEEEGIVEKAPLIKAGAIAHGTMVTKSDVKGVKVPISLVCVENDQLFPEEVLKEGQECFNESKLEHEVQVYPGVPHGFAVIGDYTDAKIQEAQKKAYEQMVGWLKSH